MSGLCPDCIIKLRQLAALRMSGSRGDRNVKREISALEQGRGSKDLEPEVLAVMDELRFKLLMIKRLGANEEETRQMYNTYWDIYTTGRGYVLNRNYSMALDNFTAIYSYGLNKEYSKAIANAGHKEMAEARINEAKTNLNAMEKGFISASPTALGERDAEIKKVRSAVNEAEDYQKSGKFEEALNALGTVGYGMPKSKSDTEK
jgi:hypothetical protein